jgi:hypothetical protein
MRSTHKYAVAGAAVVAAALAVATPGAASTTHGQSDEAHLHALNNSGVTGSATVWVRGDRVEVRYQATGLLADAPHAAHIHWGAEARHECPTVADDTNTDHRLSTAEGLPAYGPIAISLTTSGDTSPSSALAVDRFPTAPHGRIDYGRMVMTSRTVAKAIMRGDAVLVIHGLDYNHNGRYDFSGAGPSELDPNLPAEATDPAACGVIHRG